MKKPVYIRCPRCELNYIEKKDKLCSVCKAELSAKKDDFIGDLDLELCPICKTNYIQPDEIMCATCLKEHQADGQDVSDNWEEYLNRDEEEVIYDDEETGDMASVTDLDDQVLDDDLDTGIGFDDRLDDDTFDDLDDELGSEFDDDDDFSFDDDEEDEEEDDDEDDDDDDDF